MAVLAVAITGCFGIFIAWQNYLLARKVKTNHGKTIGEHTEDAAADAAEAKLAAQLVALQLQEYKNEQAVRALAEHNLIESYVDADAEAHRDIRLLIMQVAQGSHTPQPPFGG